ncbi:MAG TPA: choice-of-anchor P family protein [Terriglobia bacterium]|nr:choice-of-anchor P family protein [Terriglobia bacterium]
MEKRFLYHALSTGVSGQITLPFNELIEVQAASALPQSGGYCTSRVEDFNYKQMVSFRLAKTQAIGSYSAKDKAYNTLITATVEKLNILGQVTADLVVAHLTSKHPEAGGQPSIIPLGSYFVNLRIAGNPVDVHLETAAFTELDTYDRVCGRLESDKDWQRELLQGQEEITIPPRGGALLCSLVREVHPQARGVESKGNVLFVPHFGKVHLAEFLIQPYQRSLTMLRVELGCPVEGQVTAAHTSGNGQGYP